MRECPKCMSWWDGDTCPICEVSLMSEYSNNDGSDGVFSEPVPEPQPKFANIKVGDWVEWVYNGNVTQSEFMGFDMYHLYRMRNIGSTTSNYASESFITRILSPKEVVVDFGSGIKGTIEPLNCECCKNKVFILRISETLFIEIPFEILDPQARSIVESILKAQEEA